MTDGGYSMTEAWNLQLQGNINRMRVALQACEALISTIEATPNRSRNGVMNPRLLPNHVAAVKAAISKALTIQTVDTQEILREIEEL